jgi:hypothetical protein
VLDSKPLTNLVEQLWRLGAGHMILLNTQSQEPWASLPSVFRSPSDYSRRERDSRTRHNMNARASK